MKMHLGLPLRSLVMSLCIVLLVACSAKTPTNTGFNPAAQPALAPNRARLVLYNTPVYLAKSPADVMFKGITYCSVPDNTYVVRDIVPEPTFTIDATSCGRLAISRYGFHPVAGNIYYLRLRPNDTSAIGLLSGMSLARPIQKFAFTGPFAIEHINDASALNEMSAMTPSPVCH